MIKSKFFLVVSQNIKKAIIIGVYLGFIIPLIMAPLLIFNKSVYPFIFSKVICFQIIVDVLAILALFYFLLKKDKDKQEKQVKTPLFLVLLCFILINFIAAVFGENFSQSFWSNFERMDGLFFLSHLFIYFIIISIFFKKRDWQVFWWIFLGSSALSVFLSLIFFGFKNRRLESILGNPVYFGGFLLFPIFISLWLAVQKKHCKSKVFWIFLISFLMFFSSIFLTSSRGAILSLIISLSFISLLIIFRKGTSKKIRVSAISSFLLICLLVSGLYLARGTVFMKKTSMRRLFKIGLEENQGRLLAWKISVKSWQDKFLLGWGRENYEKAFNQHLDPEILSHAGLWFDRPHNKYLEIAVNAGILGILSYLSILGVLGYYLIKIYKKRRYLTIFFSGLLSTYLLQNLFAFDSPIVYISFFNILAFLDFNYKEFFIKNKKSNIQNDNNSNTNKILYVLLIVLLCIAFYHGNIKAIQANTIFSRVLSVQNDRSISEVYIINQYQKAFEQFPASAPSLRLVMTEKIANLAIKGDTRFRQKEVLEFLANELKKNLVLDSYDVKSYLGLAKVYQLLGVTTNDGEYLDETKKLIFQALKIYPNRPEFYRELGKTEEILGNQDKAEQYYKKAYPLEIK